MKRKRMSFSASEEVVEAIESLLWTGLNGRNRADVIERLICEAIRERVSSGSLKIDED
jgi:hypothetical protein